MKGIIAVLSIGVACIVTGANGSVPAEPAGIDLAFTVDANGTCTRDCWSPCSYPDTHDTGTFDDHVVYTGTSHGCDDGSCQGHGHTGQCSPPGGPPDPPGGGNDAADGDGDLAALPQARAVTAEDLNALRMAVRDQSHSGITELLQELGANATYNRSRSAVQVLNCRGDVVAHFPLTRAMASRVEIAMAIPVADPQ